MAKIELNVDSCKECPFLETSPYPTDDSFERPEYWWCTHKDVKQDEKNEARTFAKKIAGYVEWYDEKNIQIPEWCPIEVKE